MLNRMIQLVFDGRRGHPILLSSDCVPEILGLPDDATLKTFTQRINAHEVDVDDPGVLDDIDTPQDYDRAIHQYPAHRSEPCKQKV